MTGGTVRHLFVIPQKRAAPCPLSGVQATWSGLEGDYHARNGNTRQILLVSCDILRQFGVRAGDLRENVVVEGLDVMHLIAGQHVRVGHAVLEATFPCDPCARMDRLSSGLRVAIEGRRGMFSRVVVPGWIRVGDLIRMEEA